MYGIPGNYSRRSIRRVLYLIAGLLYCYPAAGPMSHARQSISTRAGLVTRVDGTVFHVPAEGGGREPAAAELQMKDGDRLITDVLSRAELLVNHAAYLCLDELSEVRAARTLLTDARFELLRGVFMIQAGIPGPRSPAIGLRTLDRPFRLQYENKYKLPFETATPHGILTIDTAGLYRITVEPSATWIDVYEGEIGLGARTRETGRGRLRIKEGHRAQLPDGPHSKPVLTALKLKPFDLFDRWRFPMPKHGRVRRIEGEAIAAWDFGRTDSHIVRPDFQVREGQTLTTGRNSYLQLMISELTFLNLGNETRVKAPTTGDETAAFDVTVGSVAVYTNSDRPDRPVMITTPQGAFHVRSNTVARFDVSVTETLAAVRTGSVRFGSTSIRSGERVLFRSGAALAAQTVKFDRRAYDEFDRWSLGLLSAATVVRSEGNIVLERAGGGRLELNKDRKETQAQLLEGGHLTTERGSRAALTVGSSSIHVDGESELVAVSSAKDAREFRVQKGAVIVNEGSSPAVFGTGKLKVSTPHVSAVTSGNGIFRFDVDSSETRIRVRAGSLTIPAGAAQASKQVKLKKDQAARVTASGLQILQLPDTADEFDTWSYGIREVPPIRPPIR